MTKQINKLKDLNLPRLAGLGLVIGIGIATLSSSANPAVQNAKVDRQPIDLCSYTDFEANKYGLIKPKDCPQISAITAEFVDTNPDELPAIMPDTPSGEKFTETVSENRGKRLERIQAYYNAYFPASPVKPEVILDIAIEYNIPEGFILAVGHNESHMGTRGRAVETQNPFNVGNTDFGDYKAVVCGVANKCLNSFEEGVELFAQLITNKYFHENEPVSLVTWMSRDFRAVRGDVAGKRYMTDVNSYAKYQERIGNLNYFGIDF